MIDAKTICPFVKTTHASMEVLVWKALELKHNVTARMDLMENVVKMTFPSANQTLASMEVLV